MLIPINDRLGRQDIFVVQRHEEVLHLLAVHALIRKDRLQANQLRSLPLHVITVGQVLQILGGSLERYGVRLQK